MTDEDSIEQGAEQDERPDEPVLEPVDEGEDEAIGIEIDERSCEIAENRLRREASGLTA